MRFKRSAGMIAVVFTFYCLVACAAGCPDTTTEMVSMRDGVKLATDITRPDGSGKFPAILMRTPYGKGMKDEAKRLAESGYVAVFQDIRGMGKSEGEKNIFYGDGWREDQRDGLDTVEWIKKQPWSNGSVGTAGGSALGITQVLLAPITPGVAAQSIEVAPSGLYHHTVYRGGVFLKNLVEGWLTAIGQPDRIAYWKGHPTYDEFWTYYDAEPKAGSVTAPGLHIGGWYDIFTQGTINNFLSRQHQGGEGAKGNQKLIMKWSAHGADDCPDLKLQESRFDLKVSELRNAFLAHWVKGEKNDIMEKPAVNYYTYGDDTSVDAPGMEWRTADDWPPFPTVETPYYLSTDNALVTVAPTVENTAQTFTYDPENPFPTLGGANLLIPSGPYDQRKVREGRTDLLAFATAPLDRPTEVTGRIWVRLFVSTDCPDTDFTAKLLDIYPDGDAREILIQDGIQRVKFRDGFSQAAPLLTSTDQIVEVKIDLWSTSWIFNTGHRIGLHVSSSNYPRFEKNPNTGEDFPGTTTRKAQNTVHFDAAHPSAVLLPVRPQ